MVVQLRFVQRQLVVVQDGVAAGWVGWGGWWTDSDGRAGGSSKHREGRGWRDAEGAERDTRVRNWEWAAWAGGQGGFGTSASWPRSQLRSLVFNVPARGMQAHTPGQQRPVNLLARRLPRRRRGPVGAACCACCRSSSCRRAVGTTGAAAAACLLQAAVVAGCVRPGEWKTAAASGSAERMQRQEGGGETTCAWPALPGAMLSIGGAALLQARPDATHGKATLPDSSTNRTSRSLLSVLRAPPRPAAAPPATPLLRPPAPALQQLPGTHAGFHVRQKRCCDAASAQLTRSTTRTRW